VAREPQGRRAFGTVGCRVTVLTIEGGGIRGLPSFTSACHVGHRPALSVGQGRRQIEYSPPLANFNFVGHLCLPIDS